MVKTKTYHMRKSSYRGYCIGQGVEHPGIIVSARTVKELEAEFAKAVPIYLNGVKKLGGKIDKNIEVVQVESAAR